MNRPCGSCVLPLAALQPSCKHQTHCAGYICISCSGAVRQKILTGGCERSTQVTIWCCFLLPLCLSLCVSFCQVYGKVIPPSLRKFLLVPRVRQKERVWRSNRAALLQRDTPGLAFLFIFSIFYLVAVSEHVKTAVKKDCYDTFQPRCIQEGCQTLEI